MSKSPLKKFIDLIEFDRSILLAQNEIAKIEEEIAQLKAEEVVLLEKIDHAKQAAHQARKEVDAKELEMQELDQQEKAKKARLDQVKNQKEYKSVKAALEAIHTQQSEMEVELLSVWSKLEKVQKGLEVATQEIEPKVAQIRKKIAELEQKQKDVQAELERLKQESKDKQEGIPQEWIEKYRAMKGRVPNPAVPAINSSCGGCFYTLTSEDALLLGRKALLQCKSCFRFIYKPEDQQKAAPDEQVGSDASK